MSRQTQKSIRLYFNKGINENSEIADVKTECAEALNVWAPSGHIQKRPGYISINTCATYGTDTSGAITKTTLKEDPLGTFTSSNGNISSLGVDKRWYLGFSSLGKVNDFFTINITALPKDIIGIGLFITAHNSNSTKFYAEYNDGTSWKYLNLVETIESNLGIGVGGANPSPKRLKHHFADFSGVAFNKNILCFAAPRDWAKTVVNSITAYWIRFTILEAATDATVSFTLVDTELIPRIFYSLSELSPNAGRPLYHYLFNVKLPTKNRYVSISNNLVYSGPADGYAFPTICVWSDFYRNNAYVGNATKFTEYDLAIITQKEFIPPPAFAIVVPFAESYFCVGYTNIMINHNVEYQDSTLVNTDITNIQKAQVENRNFAIGTGAPYETAVIAQLTTWPAAKYLSLIGGRLWAANLEENAHRVRWTPPIPYHKVWPEISFEDLIEDDNSPITGLVGLNEAPVIYKQDSIWLLPSAGVNQYNLLTVSIVKIVAGTGCVSNASLQQIRGEHFFLAEDGIYAFNGTPAIRKLSDKIDSIIGRITTARRQWAVAANWRKYSLYLLAVSLDGSHENNHVIAYDYKNNSFWLWDDINANSWIVDESASDDEEIYYMTITGEVYKLLPGEPTNNRGEIASKIVSHSLNKLGSEKICIRDVIVKTKNTTSSIDVSIRPEGDNFRETTGTVDLTDVNDPVWGSGGYVDSVSNYTDEQVKNGRMDFRVTCDEAEIVINHSKKTKFDLQSLEVGLNILGVR